jgi:glycosyltransferase involved in cell wall biosynthesis
MVWAGEMADAGVAHNAFDIATLTSLGEGFPNVVGEAMACGVPVAATDVGDVRAIIGETGEVVPAKNPDLLCAGWTRLRQRLGHEPGLRDVARGRIVANYSLDAMVSRTESVLTQLVAGRMAGDIAREPAAGR